MTFDPIQALIDAGAITNNPFGQNSRYRAVPFGLHRPGDGQPGVTYVLRRFIPQRRDIATQSEHILQAGERPDTLAARAMGDPELYWRIADANAVTDPFALTDMLGGRVAIPAPPGQ